MDLLDPGVYDAKLGRTFSVWQSPGFDPYEDVAAKLISAVLPISAHCRWPITQPPSGEPCERQAPISARAGQTKAVRSVTHATALTAQP